MGECGPQAIKKITSKLFTLPVQAEVDKAGDTIAHPKGLLPSIDNIMNWDFHCSEICVILLVMVYLHFDFPSVTHQLWFSKLYTYM